MSQWHTYLFPRDGTFSKVSAKHFDCQPGSHGLFHPTRCHQNILKTTLFLTVSPGRIFEWPQFPKLRLLRCPNFLPFIPLGSARGLASGRGSRGQTPLHIAAAKGHDSVVQRLLQAKAAVDAKDEDSHGLGGGYWWGNLMSPEDSVVRK